MNQSTKNVPRWLRRLDMVREELRSTRWPATAEEGFYQVLALSGHGWAQLMASLRAEKPKASVRQLEDAAHRLLRRWEDARKTIKVKPGNRKR